MSSATAHGSCAFSRLTLFRVSREPTALRPRFSGPGLSSGRSHASDRPGDRNHRQQRAVRDGPRGALGFSASLSPGPDFSRLPHDRGGGGRRSPFGRGTTGCWAIPAWRGSRLPLQARSGPTTASSPSAPRYVAAGRFVSGGWRFSPPGAASRRSRRRWRSFDLYWHGVVESAMELRRQARSQIEFGNEKGPEGFNLYLAASALIESTATGPTLINAEGEIVGVAVADLFAQRVGEGLERRG